MGSADVVPGVSGGTIALVLGIYERLIDNIRLGARVLGRAVRGDLDGAKEAFTRIDWLFLLPLLAGILIAVVSLASLIDTALEDHPEEMAGLFSGLVAGSIIVAWGLLKKAEAIHAVIAVVVGAIVFALLGIQVDALDNPNLIVFFCAGAVAICAMILPGISGSFILLMIGMYAPVLDVVSERDVGTAAVIGLGAVVGLALFSTLLHKVLELHHDIVIAVMIGLMIGSFRVLWPWPHGVGIVSEEAEEVIDGTGLEWPDGDWTWPVILAAIAFVAVLAIAAIGACTASTHEAHRQDA